MAANNVFKDQKIFIKKHLGFLIEKYKFSEPRSNSCGHDHHFVLRKKDVEIWIGNESGELPYIDIRIRKFGYKPIIHFEYPQILKDIHRKRHRRHFPKFKKAWNAENEKERKLTWLELEKDYERWGRDEQEEFIKEQAKILKKHLNVFKGRKKLEDFITSK